MSTINQYIYMKKYMLLIIILVFSLKAHTSANMSNVQDYNEHSKSLSSRELKNIICFTQLYGYIRYFYPSKASKKIDWNRFAIYGVRKVENAKNENELIIILKELFYPIAPELLLSNNPLKDISYLSDIGKRGYYKYYGFGVTPIGFPINLFYKPFKSKLIHFRNTQKEECLKEKNIMSFQLDSTIHCYLPHCVLLKNKLDRKFKESSKLVDTIELALPKMNNVEMRSRRIATIIITWNVIQHFYPYFTKTERKKWFKNLPEYINQSSLDKNKFDFYNTLSLMLGDINDGHVMINPSVYRMRFFGIIANQNKLKVYFPRIQFAIINDTVIVENVGYEYNKLLQKGDIVLKFNNTNAHQLINNKLKYVSASTSTFKKARAANILTSSFVKDSTILLIVKRCKSKQIDTVAVSTDAEYGYYKQDTSEYIREIAKGIYYINQVSDNASFKEFKKHLIEFDDARGVIIDMRGYPPYFTDKMLGYFINKKLSSADFLTPIVTYPNRENVKYISDNIYLKPQKQFIKTKLIVLTNTYAISYAESLLDMIKYYKIGTIIGSNTAGTNGDITKVRLPIFQFYFTALKVLKHNGQKLYGRGISPDIYVTPIINGIQKGKDEVLERAINYIDKTSH